MSQDEDVFSEESCASDGGSHPSAWLRAGSFATDAKDGAPRDFSFLWRNRPTYRAQLLSDRSVRPTRAMLIATAPPYPRQLAFLCVVEFLERFRVAGAGE